MGEMADYYNNEGLGTDEELEVMHKSENDKDLRIYLVTYSNGNFHSSTNDPGIAWGTARRIGGWIAELDNVYRPKYLEEVAPPKLAAQIVDFLEDPSGGVRRGRPARNPDEPSFDTGIGEAAEVRRSQRSREIDKKAA